MMRTKCFVCMMVFLAALVGIQRTAAQVCFVCNYETSRATYSVCTDGEYAYMGSMGLIVVDISDPASPSETAWMSGYPFMDVTVAGSYVYAGCLSCGFNIIDVSDPTTPTQIGNYQTSGPVHGVYVVGSYAYLGAHQDGLLIINISDPASPTLAGSFTTPGPARDLDVVGDYAYLAESNSGLLIIDITDPASPTLIGSYSPLSAPEDVEVVGNYAYVACNTGLYIINISNPASPTLVAFYEDDLGNNFDICITGDFACMARDLSGVQIIDISNPTSPTLVENYLTPGEAEGVAVYGSYVYVADYVAGMTVLETGDMPAFTVNSPYGGESWCAGDSQEIAWRSCRSSIYAMIEYSTNGGADWEPVTASTPNDGSYSWTIPNTPSIDCMIRVCDPQEPGICGECENAFKISGCGPLGILTETLPDGPEKVYYEENLVATGGVLPYSWALVDGELPPGLNLDTVMGTISGKPQELGTFCFTIELQEDLGVTDSQGYCITIVEYTGMTGDVNFDGDVNILDVLATVNHVLGITPLTGDPLIWADCNGDDDVNIVDSLGIVNVILGIGGCVP